MSSYGYSQGPWQIVMLARSRPNDPITKFRDFFVCVFICDYSQRTCHLAINMLSKMVQFSLGLNQCFITSFTDPQFPTRTLLSMDFWKITVPLRGNELGNLLFSHLLIGFKSPSRRLNPKASGPFLYLKQPGRKGMSPIPHPTSTYPVPHASKVSSPRTNQKIKTTQGAGGLG